MSDLRKIIRKAAEMELKEVIKVESTGIAQATISFRQTLSKREWVGLTQEEIMDVSEMRTGSERYQWVERVIRNAEAKLKEKNT